MFFIPFIYYNRNIHLETLQRLYPGLSTFNPNVSDILSPHNDTNYT